MLDNLIMDAPMLNTLEQVWHNWVDIFVLTSTELHVCFPPVATLVLSIMISMADWLMFHSRSEFNPWLAFTIVYTDLAAFHMASAKARPLHSPGSPKHMQFSSDEFRPSQDNPLFLPSVPGTLAMDVNAEGEPKDTVSVHSSNQDELADDEKASTDEPSPMTSAEAALKKGRGHQSKSLKALLDPHMHLLV
ncbi:uncharacterized protein LAESUDRAFT_762341 [Laetiporus sulphureus 93-53]|uniref:Uncharacterized protein n=1 Tax=Laetiporus sulphureus 93-53 TaxID=1314785 RepID=A0A165CJ86_9APHY|nr:uncharacterized protein LAESUDRAFT_762341 [Laetiporus sulphureus 93-53]KZT02909.1 hypothetical protein LAESUDRAFT_762341 [Laetiporus sulphureus 93-53]